MKEAKFTFQTYCEQPPSPHIEWTGAAIESWLQLQGFDLSKSISREEDCMFGVIIFRQKD
jgi:hypothetical protein